MPFSRSRSSCSLLQAAVLISGLAGGSVVHAQTVTVGAGGYTTTLPSGAKSASLYGGAPATPKVTADFVGPVATNEFWSSLIWPFFGNQHSALLAADPAFFQAYANGLGMGYTPEPTLAGRDVLHPYAEQLRIRVAGLNAPETKVAGYGDWTAKTRWDDGTHRMTATLGHGLPFVYLTEATGGDAEIAFSSAPTIWTNDGIAVGLSVSGRHYGVFGPTGSTWTYDSNAKVLRSSLAGGPFFSVALLPDASATTFALFREHAYAFVTDSKVRWRYDEATARMTSTFELTTQPMVLGASPVALQALYRHQWIHTTAPMTGSSYPAVLGTMKLMVGNSFSTTTTFNGVLPSLPLPPADAGSFNASTLQSLLDELSGTPNFPLTSYASGRTLIQLADAVRIAHEVNKPEIRDHLLGLLKTQLESWLTAGGPQQFYYDSRWNSLIGYPADFGADTEFNDHHFHDGYLIRAAATVAQFDREWASEARWGGMIRLLIKEANNWDRSDKRFPFLRSLDPYVGHSWAAGHGAFGDGNNQESSSEAMNFASATLLWGTITGDTEIRDLGVFLYETERTGTEQYWFDVDNAVYPANYPYNGVGIVFGTKLIHETWFGGAPEYIHGINMLPLHGGSLYLGRHPDHIKAVYNEVVAENGNRQPDEWQDILWMYLGLGDPDAALRLYKPALPSTFHTRAQLYEWLHSLAAYGQLDTTVTADIVTAATFRKGSKRTHVAYNPAPDARTVTFSDGYSMSVPGNTMFTDGKGADVRFRPLVKLEATPHSGAAPLLVQFNAAGSTDQDGTIAGYAWTFGDGSSSTEAAPSHLYTAVGIYTVKLTVTDNSGLSSTDSTAVLLTTRPEGILMSPTLYLRDGAASGTPGALSSTPGTTPTTDAIPGGPGGVQAPPLVYQMTNVTAPLNGDRTSFNLRIDAGSNVGEGTGARILYDFDGNGTYDRTETFGYFATDPIAGTFERYTDGDGPTNVTGSYANLLNGTVRLELTRAIGSGSSLVRVDATAADLNGSWIKIPFGGTTAVGDRTDERPTAFALLPATPNPFNPTTTLRYALLAPSRVRLEIFDALGRKVRTLVDEAKSAGSYTATFDATGLPSGLYLARLSAGSLVRSQRMMLVK